LQVLTGSFLLRIAAFAKPQYGLISAKLPGLLAEKTPKFKRWLDATIAQDSVNFIWDEEKVSTRTAKKFAAKV
jgi:glutathione S-transferase